VLQCVVVCCSVLQCVTVCCSVLQCFVVCCRLLQRLVAVHVAVCYSASNCVAAYVAANRHAKQPRRVRVTKPLRVAVCATGCCTASQCVTVCCCNVCCSGTSRSARDNAAASRSSRPVGSVSSLTSAMMEPRAK